MRARLHARLEPRLFLVLRRERRFRLFLLPLAGEFEDTPSGSGSPGQRARLTGAFLRGAFHVR